MSLSSATHSNRSLEQLSLISHLTRFWGSSADICRRTIRAPIGHSASVQAKPSGPVSTSTGAKVTSDSMCYERILKLVGAKGEWEIGVRGVLGIGEDRVFHFICDEGEHVVASFERVPDALIDCVNFGGN